MSLKKYVMILEVVSIYEHSNYLIELLTIQMLNGGLCDHIARSLELVDLFEVINPYSLSYFFTFLQQHFKYELAKYLPTSKLDSMG